jgi:hypothetical protein
VRLQGVVLAAHVPGDLVGVGGRLEALGVPAPAEVGLLDDAAAGRHGALLVLPRESDGAHALPALEVLQDVLGETRGKQQLALGLARVLPERLLRRVERRPGRDGEGLAAVLGLEATRQAQVLPPSPLEQVARQVLVVDPLHDDDFLRLGRVVEARRHGRGLPVDDLLALQLAARVGDVDGVVDHQGVAAPARALTADRRDRSASPSSCWSRSPWRSGRSASDHSSMKLRWYQGSRMRSRAADAVTQGEAVHVRGGQHAPLGVARPDPRRPEHTDDHALGVPRGDVDDQALDAPLGDRLQVIADGLARASPRSAGRDRRCSQALRTKREKERRQSSASTASRSS